MEAIMNTSNAGFMFRHVMPKAGYKVSRQDSSMTSPQSPRYMRETPRKDLHSKFDQPGQRYRPLMMEMVARQEAGGFGYRDNVRSEERRWGKEGYSTVKYWWVTANKKKKE